MISRKDKHISVMKYNQLKVLGVKDSIVARRLHFPGSSFWSVESALHLLWPNPWKASKDKVMRGEY